MLNETFCVIFKHRASKDNFFHSCSSVHVPVSCSLSVVSLVSSQSRRDGDVCASINKSNWHLVAFTIIIITFKLFSFYLCTAGDTSCVSIEEARQRPSSSMVAFSRMSHINYSTGNFLTPVSLSLFSFLAISKLSERWIHLCRGGNDWWKTSFPDFRINTACSPGLTGRCFMFATVMHHVTKILEGQDKGQLFPNVQCLP